MIIDDDAKEWLQRDWRLNHMHYLPEEDLVYYISYILYAMAAPAVEDRLRMQL